MGKVDFNVDFFYGENEDALFAATLNDIQVEELPQFVKALQDFAEENTTNSIRVTGIELDGCDDALIMIEGREPIEICSETTFAEMVDLVVEAS